MSAWMGLHNPERHKQVVLWAGAFGAQFMDDAAICRWCFDRDCSRTRPCRCCLAAEVDLLRAEKVVAAEELEQAIHNIERLLTQVKRVRELHVIEVAADEESEVCRECAFTPTVGDEVCPTIRALDGGDA